MKLEETIQKLKTAKLEQYSAQAESNSAYLRAIDENGGNTYDKVPQYVKDASNKCMVAIKKVEILERELISTALGDPVSPESTLIDWGASKEELPLAEAIKTRPQYFLETLLLGRPLRVIDAADNKIVRRYYDPQRVTLVLDEDGKIAKIKSEI